MTKDNKNTIDVLIIGAGPAGLAAAIQLKTANRELRVCVIDKAHDLGNHNLSGAVLESLPLFTLLTNAYPEWKNSDFAKELLDTKIQKDDILFLLGKKLAFPLYPLMKLAKLCKLSFGQMIHKGDYIVSVSKLTKFLGEIATQKGVEVLTGFAASDIFLDDQGKTTSVKLVDQGLDKDHNKQPNYIEGETLEPKFVILAEGCDGLVTEKFVEKANLKRKTPQLFSIGVKEIIKVTPQQYEKFTNKRVVHAMGYPLWTPVIGPAVFGGGIIYPVEADHLAVAMIAAADFKYKDFNPQDALTLFKKHRSVDKYIHGSTVVEAGAKMIPEAGLYGIPTDSHGNYGKENCLIIGDAAGFVNMLKIKGLHNAIHSGILAAKAIVESTSYPKQTAARYTELVKCSDVFRQMDAAKKYRQTIAKLGPLFGLPFSILGNFLPKFKTEPDYKATKPKTYRHKPANPFDKDAFTAAAATEHREDQPCHLEIINPNTCAQKCKPKFDCPCITFCPAGVYETVQGNTKAANPSNCLHCKTCQRKCPFDNIRWTAPEGTGGPRYKRM